MVNTSTRPITVDGVRLDTLAWNVEKVERATASRRSGDYSTPLMDGSIAGLNDALEPSIFGLQMWLRGTDVDGAVPANGQTSKLRDNLDELLHLFGKRHALLDVREAVGGLTENTTNLVKNPSGAVNASSWLATNGTVSRVDGEGIDGHALKVVTTGAIGWNFYPNGVGSNAMPIVAGQTAYYKIRLKNVDQAPSAINVQFYWYTAAGAANGTTSVATGVPISASAWTDSAWSTTAPAGTAFFTVAIGATSTATGQGILWDQAIATAGVDAPYFSGDTPSTPDAQYAWTGTPNASTSTRVSRPYRRCWAKVVEAIAPDINTAGSAGVFSVALTIPAAMWEEPDQQDLLLTAPITAAEVTTMQGSTERINDAVYLVKGPANTPRITDPSSGMFVELGQNLPAGSFWRFSSGSWASRVGTTLTLGSMDTDGTDVAGVTGVGGPSRAYGLPLVPVRDAGARRVGVTLSAASGIVNGTTQLSIRARRKYAA